MAIILVNKDGTSNAKAGDIVVTGGGLYQKNPDGTSTKVGGLNTKTGTSGNFSDVVSTFSQLVGGGGGNSGGDKVDTTGAAERDYTVKSVDDNGLINLETYGYDPTDYTAYSSSSSTNISTVLGYIVLGLVGVALLDRFMNGKG